MKKGFLFISILPLVLLTWISNADAIRYRIIFPAPVTNEFGLAPQIWSRSTLFTLANLSLDRSLTIEDIDVIDAATGTSAMRLDNAVLCPFVPLVDTLPFTLAPLAGGQSELIFSSFGCVVGFKDGRLVGKPLNHPDRAGFFVILTVDGVSERDIRASSEVIDRVFENGVVVGRGTSIIPATFQRIK